VEMKNHEVWKNFNLGEELEISGNFIYNGLRRFYEMQVLDYHDEIFEVLYNLSVGLERLLKITVILVEHKDDSDQEALEKSLITHTHLELMRRVKEYCDLDLGKQHNEFLALLGNFYNSYRYDRFILSSIFNRNQERTSLLSFLSKHLNIDLEKPSGLFATQNNIRYRKFIRKIVIKISSTLFEIVRDKASELNLYTYELRHGSRAETTFLGAVAIHNEEVLWKELLVFFMNTKAKSGYLDFLQSIKPLDFDPALISDYLQCFQSDTAKAFVMGELEYLYDELEKSGERLKMMDMIADPNVDFDSDEEVEEETQSPL
jgi:hypothetical protein